MPAPAYVSLCKLLADSSREDAPCAAYDALIARAEGCDAPTWDRAVAWLAARAPYDTTHTTNRTLESLWLALRRANLDSVRAEMRARTGRDDLAGDLFEPYLATRTAADRRARGVYFTPDAVVAYILRSVAAVARERFGATPVRLIDSAAGTGAFVRSVHAKFAAESVGIERFAEAARVLTLLDAIRGVKGAARCSVGDSLAAPDSVLHAATAIARGERVVALVGNPPYAGHSKNQGDAIGALLHGRDPTDPPRAVASYFHVDGEPLGERNPKWLNDDYVKFVRVAHWVVERVGRGIVAMICNHGFLDHPTHRGMRDALCETFDDVWVLDLHGSTKRGERALDGSVDENVFEILSGVSIAIFVREWPRRRARALVHHAEIFGTRDAKLTWLSTHDVATTTWTRIEPSLAHPGMPWVPRAHDAEFAREYERGVRLPDAMPVYSPAVVTGCDERRIDENRERLLNHVAEDLRAMGAKTPLDPDDRDGLAAYVQPCAYRPFDVRWIFFYDALLERSRHRVMQHMVGDTNVALIARRQMLPGRPCTYFGVARHIVSDGAIRSDNHGTESVFPLYIGMMNAREGNFTAEFLAGCTRSCGVVPSARDALDYTYALFHSDGYRTRYAEALRTDFPRVLWPRDGALFAQLRALGEELTRAHLDGVAAPGVQLASDSGGAARIVRVRREGGRVWISDTHWITGVDDEAWEAAMGGYVPCAKWLKDRAGEVLSAERVAHYARVVGAMRTTRVIAARIDAAIAEAGGWPIG